MTGSTSKSPKLTSLIPTLVRRQSTLRNTAMCAGVELHGGEHTRLVMRPAPIGTGLVFVRTDVTDRNNKIAVRPDAVTGVRNCTTLSNPAGVKVSTIEHLLAALSATGIDNLYLDLDGEELPALDGSSEPFLKLIEQVGIKRQAGPRKYIRVVKTIEVTQGLSTARIEPCERLELDVTIDFEDDAAIGNEFVRHKALDLLGDLYLGGPILGRVTTVRGGHGINHDLLMALFSDKDAWRFETLPMPKDLMAKDGKSHPRSAMPA